MIKKLFNTWKVLDQERDITRLQWKLIIILVMIIMAILYSIQGIKEQLRHQTLFVAPAQIMKGGYYHANIIPDQFVYGFTYQIFVALNTWSDNARNDYLNNINTYRFLITPHYKDYLLNDYKQSVEEGNLQGSIQVMSPYSGMDYSDHDAVTRVNDNTWLVTMKLRVTHYKDNLILMDVLYDYKVRVVRVAESGQFNPWGMAIDSVVSKIRLKTFT